MRIHKDIARPSKGFTLTRDPQALPDLAPAWAVAAQAASSYVEPVEDYLAAENADDWLVLSEVDGPPLLPFLTQPYVHKFTVGERKLGSMSMRALRLVNPWLAETTAPETIAAAVRHALIVEPVELVQLGEIPTDSHLRNALDALQWPARLKRVGRKDGIRWLIDLPESFDAYMGQLSSSSRQSTKRKIRKLYKDFEVTLEVFDRSDMLKTFLEKGEAISRMTYQWQVGQRLVDDLATLKAYQRLAHAGRLRCYLMSLDGVPRAFMRGTLQDGLYHYETPGFDPDFARNSIGTVLLMEALRDLIEHTDAKVFDFGTGGDDVGYKSTYGTQSFPCASYYVLNMRHPNSLRLMAFESGLTMIKNMADRLLPSGETRAKIKRRLRKY